MCVIDAPRQRKKSKKPRKSNPSPLGEQLTGPPPASTSRSQGGKEARHRRRVAHGSILHPKISATDGEGALGGGGGGVPAASSLGRTPTGRAKAKA